MKTIAIRIVCGYIAINIVVAGVVAAAAARLA